MFIVYILFFFPSPSLTEVKMCLNHGMSLNHSLSQTQQSETMCDGFCLKQLDLLQRTLNVALHRAGLLPTRFICHANSCHFTQKVHRFQTRRQDLYSEIHPENSGHLEASRKPTIV